MDALLALADKAKKPPVAPSAGQTPWLPAALLPPTWVETGRLPAALLLPSLPCESPSPVRSSERPPKKPAKRPGAADPRAAAEKPRGGRMQKPAKPQRSPAVGLRAAVKKPRGGCAQKPAELQRSPVVDLRAAAAHAPRAQCAPAPHVPHAQYAPPGADFPLLRREPRAEDVCGALGEIGKALRRQFVMEAALDNRFRTLGNMPNALLDDPELVEIFLAHGAAAGYPAVVCSAIALGARDFAAARAEAAAAASLRGRPAADAGQVERVLREAEALRRGP